MCKTLNDRFGGIAGMISANKAKRQAQAPNAPSAPAAMTTNNRLRIPMA